MFVARFARDLDMKRVLVVSKFFKAHSFIETPVGGSWCCRCEAQEVQFEQ